MGCASSAQHPRAAESLPVAPTASPPATARTNAAAPLLPAAPRVDSKKIVDFFIAERKHLNLATLNMQSSQVLGSGAFGEVRMIRVASWRDEAGAALSSEAAQQRGLPCMPADSGEAKLALKVLSKKHILETAQVTHLFEECRILQNLNDNPFVVRYIRSFQSPGSLFILMECAPKGELFELLAKKGKLEKDTTRLYASELALGLDKLHKSLVVYRDFKPENILFAQNGHVKLCDFGLAKQMANRDDRAFTLCGTHAYLSPELVSSSGHSFPVDFWALGIVIVEMLTSESPYQDADARVTYRKILTESVKWEKYPDLLKAEKSCIAGLLDRSEDERLNMASLKDHVYFGGTYDWEGVEKLEIDAPGLPIHFRPKKDMGEPHEAVSDELQRKFEGFDDI